MAGLIARRAPVLSRLLVDIIVKNITRLVGELACFPAVLRPSSPLARQLGIGHRALLYRTTGVAPPTWPIYVVPWNRFSPRGATSETLGKTRNYALFALMLGGVIFPAPVPADGESHGGSGPEPRLVKFPVEVREKRGPSSYFGLVFFPCACASKPPVPAPRVVRSRHCGFSGHFATESPDSPIIDGASGSRYQQ